MSELHSAVPFHTPSFLHLTSLSFDRAGGSRHSGKKRKSTWRFFWLETKRNCRD
jgi:hypothetical protein